MLLAGFQSLATNPYSFLQ